MTLSMEINTLKLPKELEERFDGLAKLKGITKDSLILKFLPSWMSGRKIRKTLPWLIKSWPELRQEQ